MTCLSCGQQLDVYSGHLPGRSDFLVCLHCAHIMAISVRELTVEEASMLLRDKVTFQLREAIRLLKEDRSEQEARK